MIALFNDLYLTGYTYQSQDCEQLPTNITPGKNDPTPWTDPLPLQTLVDNSLKVGDYGVYFQIYGAILQLDTLVNGSFVDIVTHVYFSNPPVADRIMTIRILTPGAKP